MKITLERGPGSALIYLPLLLPPLFIASPLLLKGGNLVLGGEKGELWGHLWTYFMVKHSLLDLQSLPFSTHLISFPGGTRFFPIDIGSALLSIPFQALSGNVWQGYNAVILLHTFLAATTAFLLVKRVTGMTAISHLCGILYGLVPFHISSICDGLSELFALWIFPLLLILLLKMRDEGGVRIILSTSLLISLTPWFSGYHLFSILFFLPVFLLDSTFIHGKRGWVTLKRTALVLLIAVPLSLPFGYLFMRYEYRSGWIGDGFDSSLKRTLLESVFDSPERMEEWPGSSSNWSDINTLFPFFHPIAMRWKGGEDGRKRMFHSSYTSFILWMVLAALLFTKYRRGAGIWWALTPFLFSIICIGSIPYFRGERVDLFGLSLPFPFYSMIKFIPYLYLLMNSYRFSPMIYLSLIFSLGLLCSGIGTRYGRAWGNRLALSLSLLVFLEWSLFSPAPYPPRTTEIEVPELLLMMRKHRREGGLTQFPTSEFPPRTGPGMSQKHYFLQAIHHIPLTDSYSSKPVRSPPDHHLKEEVMKIFLKEYYESKGLKISRRALRELRKGRIRFILIHKIFIKGEILGRLKNYLSDLEALGEDGGYLIYRVY